MLLRCCGEATRAASTWATEGPSPMFSPTEVHPGTTGSTSAARSGVWNSVFAAAMAAECRRATADSPPLTLRDEPRVALMALTTVASAEERAAAGRAPAKMARTPSTTPPASSQGRRLRGGSPIRPRPAAREAGADM